MKVGVVGAGNVGSTVAQHIVEKELAELALVDAEEGLAKGKALDLEQAGAILGADVHISGSTDIALLAGSDVVVVAAGFPRQPGMERIDLLTKNVGVIEEVCEGVRKHAPSAILIMVTNPLDVLSYVAWKVTRFPRERVIGMAGILDSARLRTFLAKELDVSPKEISATVLGGHGETMVPLLRLIRAFGVTEVTGMLPGEKIGSVVSRTVSAGAEIVALYKRGGAFYAPGAAVFQMVDSILRDRKSVFPCSVLLQGEYGLWDVFLGVPVKLGRAGMEGVVEIELQEEELRSLQDAARRTKKAIGEAMSILG